MNTISQHFRQHGVVHALWTIGVLIAIIAALLLRLPDGKSVGDYIAFSASIASLVLAVVAIGQSLVANQGFSETIGSLRETASSVERAAKNIADTSSVLSEQSERMIGEVSQLSPAFEDLSAKVDERFSQLKILSSSIISEDGEQSSADDPMQLFEAGPVGGRAALYILALSFRTATPIIVNQVFDGGHVWPNFLAGYLQALKNTSPFGLKLDFIAPDVGPTFTVQSMGMFSADELIDRFEKWEVGKQLSVKAQIESYFDKAASAQHPEEGEHSYTTTIHENE